MLTGVNSLLDFSENKKVFLCPRNNQFCIKLQVAIGKLILDKNMLKQ